MPLDSQLDYAQHLYSNLPCEWFPQPTWEDAPVIERDQQEAPNLKALLRGLAAGYASDHISPSKIGYQDQINYTKAQSRIRTAAGFWLDYVAADFFGKLLQRHPNESDANFRKRLLVNLLADHGTRCAIVCNLTNLTGYKPKIIEFMNTNDCGGYGSLGQTYTVSTGPKTSKQVPYASGMGYGVAGAYGSLKLPFQALVNAYRPLGEGIAFTNGYGGSLSGYASLPRRSGYHQGEFVPNTGMGQYCDLDEISGSVTDQDIYDTVARSSPAGTTCWTNISDFVEANPHYSTGLLDLTFYLDGTCLAGDTIPPDALRGVMTALSIKSYGTLFQPLVFAPSINALNITSVTTINNPIPIIGYVTIPFFVEGALNINPVWTRADVVHIASQALLAASNTISGNITIPFTAQHTVNTQSPIVATITPLAIKSQAYLISQGIQITVLNITSRTATPSVDILGTFVIGQGVLGSPGGRIGVSWQIGSSKLGVDYGW